MAEATLPSITNYKILSRLSSGGMGAVFLAEDLKLNRPVAVFDPCREVPKHDGKQRQRCQIKACG